MRKYLAAGSGACLLALATPALAQEATTEADEPERPWSLSLGGGVSLISNGEDPWSSSVDLTRTVGDASLSLGYSRSSDNGQVGVPLSLASKSETISASVGYSLGSVSIDVHGSYGVRRFDGRQFRRRSGQVVTIDGKAPNPAAVKSYPLSRPTFLYTAGEPAGNTKAFIDFCLSPAGEAIISKAGFVALSAK